MSWPFGVTQHLTPFQHIPLPAKIRTELLEPVYLTRDKSLADDPAYIDSVYEDIEARSQAGMDRLASKRKFLLFF